MRGEEKATYSFLAGRGGGGGLLLYAAKVLELTWLLYVQRERRSE